MLNVSGWSISRGPTSAGFKAAKDGCIIDHSAGTAPIGQSGEMVIIDGLTYESATLSAKQGSWGDMLYFVTCTRCNVEYGHYTFKTHRDSREGCTGCGQNVSPCKKYSGGHRNVLCGSCGDTCCSSQESRHKCAKKELQKEWQYFDSNGLEVNDVREATSMKSRMPLNYNSDHLPLLSDGHITKILQSGGVTTYTNTSTASPVLTKESLKAAQQVYSRSGIRRAADQEVLDALFQMSHSREAKRKTGGLSKLFFKSRKK